MHMGMLPCKCKQLLDQRPRINKVMQCERGDADHRLTDTLNVNRFKERLDSHLMQGAGHGYLVHKTLELPPHRFIEYEVRHEIARGYHSVDTDVLLDAHSFVLRASGKPKVPHHAWLGKHQMCMQTRATKQTGGTTKLDHGHSDIRQNASEIVQQECGTLRNISLYAMACDIFHHFVLKALHQSFPCIVMSQRYTIASRAMSRDHIFCMSQECVQYISHAQYRSCMPHGFKQAGKPKVLQKFGTQPWQTLAKTDNTHLVC